jgi:hypothetical protein
LEKYTVYYLVYLLFALLGLFVEPYFYSFLLLDLIVKNSTTRNVLQAVYQPRYQLGAITVVAIFTVYIYAFFVFQYFRQDVAGGPQESDCFTLFSCLKLTLGHGIRQQAGVGDVLEPTLGSRWLLDVTFYVFVLTIVLNLVYGIIIMTFGALREEQNERRKDTENICFICGIEKLVFDRLTEKRDGFSIHIRDDHHMWNYARFMIFLWEQSKDFDDGLEQYVRRAIETNDLTWFPTNKSLRLQEADLEGDTLMKALKSKVESTDATLTSKLDLIEYDISRVLELAAQALKSEHVEQYQTHESRPSSVSMTTLGHRPSTSNTKLDALLRVDRPKPVFFQVLYVTLSDPALANNHVSVKVLFDNALVYNVPARATRSDRVIFKSKLHLLCSNGQSGDNRECTVIISRKRYLLGSGDQPHSKVDDVIATMRFTVGELVCADGFCMDKYFTLPPPQLQTQLEITTATATATASQPTFATQVATEESAEAAETRSETLSEAKQETNTETLPSKFSKLCVYTTSVNPNEEHEASENHSNAP